MKNVRVILPLVNAAPCAVLLVLLLIDAIWPAANLFLNGFVKAFILVTGLVSAVCGGILIASQRRRERQARIRRAR